MRTAELQYPYRQNLAQFKNEQTPGSLFLSMDTGMKRRIGFFERQPRIIILFHEDCPAVDKSQLSQEILHDRVVAVGIDAQVSAL